MIIVGIVVGLVTVLAAGLGVTLLLLRGLPRLSVLECFALSWLFGCGIISLLLWGGGFILSGVLLQLCVAAIAVSLAFCGIATARSRGMRLGFPRPRNPLEWILVAFIALEVLVMFYGALIHRLGWDGLLNWEIKARIAFLNDGVLPAAYYASERDFSHPFYPLSIPLTEVWFYMWMGEPHQFWIKIIFPLYYAASAILLVSLAGRITNRRWPGLVVAALGFFVPFLFNTPGGPTGGYADFPLAVLYLATLGYLICYGMSGQAWALRTFAVSAALLPWTKQEGIILWAIAMCAASLLFWRRLASRRLLLWLLPGALIILAWKVFLAGIHASSQRDFVAVTVHNFSAGCPRILPIARMAMAEMLATSHWSLFWPFLLLAIGFLALRKRDLPVFVFIAALVVPIPLYAMTYLFSGMPDYAAHFEASFSRLLLQVMPAGWLAIAWIMAAPGNQSPSSDNVVVEA
jgi:hypothetical protein